MHRLPPLNALRAFESAARHASFQEAAEELCVTPTAVSHQIRQLEEQLGCPLFHRHPRPIRLTVEGERLFPGLRDGFDRIAGALDALQPMGPRPLIVTTTPALASRWLIPRLDTIREACGGARMAIQATEAVTHLLAGEADLALRYARGEDPDLACHALFQDRYFPVCSPSLFGNRPLPRTPAELAAYPIIEFDWKSRDRKAPTWQRWFELQREYFSEVGPASPETVLRFSEETHAIEAAILGQGVALLSDRVVSRELESGALMKALDASIEGLTLYAMYPPDTPYAAIFTRLVDHVRHASAS